MFNNDIKKELKAFLDKGGVPSQFMTTNKLGGGKKPVNLSVMVSVLKQINAKLRLDLYRLNFAQFRNPLIIGIDLVMSGSSKLIGCSATSNKNLTQCFTKMYKQKMVSVT